MATIFEQQGQPAIRKGDLIWVADIPNPRYTGLEAVFDGFTHDKISVYSRDHKINLQVKYYRFTNIGGPWFDAGTHEPVKSKQAISNHHLLIFNEKLDSELPITDSQAPSYDPYGKAEHAAYMERERAKAEGEDEDKWEMLRGRLESIMGRDLTRGF